MIDRRQRSPDLEPRMEAAREIARQTALEGIKTAGEKDWRALAEWLKLAFPDYRQGNNINISSNENKLSRRWQERASLRSLI